MADEIGGRTGSGAIGASAWGVVGLSGTGSAAVGVGAGAIDEDAVSISITAPPPVNKQRSEITLCSRPPCPHRGSGPLVRQPSGHPRVRGTLHLTDATVMAGLAAGEDDHTVTGESRSLFDPLELGRQPARAPAAAHVGRADHPSTNLTHQPTTTTTTFLLF